MTVELSKKAAQLLERQLAKGEFASAEEVVERALGFFDQCYPEHPSCIDPLTQHSLSPSEVSGCVQQGLDDVAAGRIIVCNDDEELKGFFEDVKRRGRERFLGDQHGE